MEKIKNNRKTFESIELLNSEGPILKAYKIGKSFLIVDEWSEPIQIFKKDEMEDFIFDRRILMDSKGKGHLYGRYPGSMKPDLRKLSEFIGLPTEGITF
jgi:hypothetical protein